MSGAKFQLGAIFCVGVANFVLGLKFWVGNILEMGQFNNSMQKQIYRSGGVGGGGVVIGQVSNSLRPQVPECNQ